MVEYWMDFTVWWTIYGAFFWAVGSVPMFGYALYQLVNTIQSIRKTYLADNHTTEEWDATEDGEKEGERLFGCFALAVAAAFFWPFTLSYILWVKYFENKEKE